MFSNIYTIGLWVNHLSNLGLEQVVLLVWLGKEPGRAEGRERGWVSDTTLPSLCSSLFCFPLILRNFKDGGPTRIIQNNLIILKSADFILILSATIFPFALWFNIFAVSGVKDMCIWDRAGGCIILPPTDRWLSASFSASHVFLSFYGEEKSTRDFLLNLHTLKKKKK